MRKIFIIVILLFLCFCPDSSSDEIRKPAVAGSFYPADKKELENTLDLFLQEEGMSNTGGRLLGIIVPHAGYVYSGRVAGAGFKQLQGRIVNSVVIMCNAHTPNYFSGIAIDNSNIWETPLGRVTLDRELADKLVNFSSQIQYNSNIHKSDHTIEVQVPFLQRVLKKDFKIVPILFGMPYTDSYKVLANALAKNLGKDDIVIVSTDMSHYPKYEDANRIDIETTMKIKDADISKLETHIREVMAHAVPREETLLCGIDGVRTLMELYNILGGGNIEVLKYANSGDADIGDKSRVVGYSAIAFMEGVTMEDKYLTKEEKKKLIEIAKSSIREAVTGKRQFEPNVIEPKLKENCGAFVTITKQGELRGCIGYITAVRPLYETVRDVARSSAINDYRFSPLSEKELSEIEIEISVLTPLKLIKSVDEIKVGENGIYIKRGFNSGLLLPQVATEYGWDKETFLQHTCIKAGLPIDAWKDKSTEIYIFSAEVFGEGEVL